MPKKVKLEDGTEIEVPTEEETKETNEKLAKVDTLTEENTKLKSDNEALGADDGNRNWKQMRETQKIMKDALKADGKDVDDKGNIIEKSQALTAEDIAKITTDNVNKALLQNQIDISLSGLDTEKREVVMKSYEKVITGEEVNTANINTFIDQAKAMSSVETPNNQAGNAAGAVVNSANGPAKPNTDGEKFSESSDGKSLGDALGLDLAPKEDK